MSLVFVSEKLSETPSEMVKHVSGECLQNNRETIRRICESVLKVLDWRTAKTSLLEGVVICR